MIQDLGGNLLPCDGIVVVDEVPALRYLSCAHHLCGAPAVVGREVNGLGDTAQGKSITERLCSCCGRIMVYAQKCRGKKGEDQRSHGRPLYVQSGPGDVCQTAVMLNRGGRRTLACHEVCAELIRVAGCALTVERRTRQRQRGSVWLCVGNGGQRNVGRGRECCCTKGSRFGMCCSTARYSSGCNKMDWGSEVVAYFSGKKWVPPSWAKSSLSHFSRRCMEGTG